MTALPDLLRFEYLRYSLYDLAPDILWQLSDGYEGNCEEWMIRRSKRA